MVLTKDGREHAYEGGIGFWSISAKEDGSLIVQNRVNVAVWDRYAAGEWVKVSTFIVGNDEDRDS